MSNYHSQMLLVLKEAEQMLKGEIKGGLICTI